MVRRRYTVPALISAFLLSLVTIIPASANNTAQTLPFTQNWSTTGNLLTIENDWSSVDGIVGFLGQDLTTTTGTDPQTFLGESSVARDVDVIPNQTNTGITNGGVAEFEITNPVVALQGSGTADAPYLLFYLDTTGAANITVAYNLRDIDGTADNAAQQVALQYRVGSTGNFTNVPAGYVADATTAGAATLVTPVSAVLPPPRAISRSSRSVSSPRTLSATTSGLASTTFRSRAIRSRIRRRHPHQRVRQPRRRRRAVADARAHSHTLADAFADADSGRDQDQPGLRRRRKQRRDLDQRLHRTLQPDGRSRVAFRLVGPVRLVNGRYLAGDKPDGHDRRRWVLPRPGSCRGRRHVAPSGSRRDRDDRDERYRRQGRAREHDDPVVGLLSDESC